jgi:hypothetical protein
MLQTLTRDISNVMVEANRIGLFVSLCTVQQPDGVFGASGAPSGNHLPVSGLVNIICQLSPPTDSTIRATEVKSLEEILREGFRHLLLNGYYPQMTPDNQIPQGWQAVVDGVTYEILGVEHDSQQQMTRLQVRLVQL